MQSLTATELETWSAGTGQPPLLLADLDRTRSVACIRHHGVRYAQVVAFLLQQGGSAVYNLTAGIDAGSLAVGARILPCRNPIAPNKDSHARAAPS